MLQQTQAFRYLVYVCYVKRVASSVTAGLYATLLTIYKWHVYFLQRDHSCLLESNMNLQILLCCV